MEAIKVFQSSLEIDYRSQIIGSTSVLHLAGSLVEPPGMRGSQYMSHAILTEQGTRSAWTIKSK